MTFAPEASFPLLGPDRVIELHALGLAQYGGNEGVRDMGLLLSAIHGAQTAAMYESDDGELDVLHVAAHLLYHIARNHAFLDGNKRVAWLTCEEQLRLADLRIVATTDNAELLMLSVVKGEVESAEVIEWIAARLSSYEPTTPADAGREL